MHSKKPRNFRPKAFTWLERDAQPGEPHVRVEPNAGVVLPGGPDEEGRFVVCRQEAGHVTHWVGDRRHWTEVPAAPDPSAD